MANEEPTQRAVSGAHTHEEVESTTHQLEPAMFDEEVLHGDEDGRNAPLDVRHLGHPNDGLRARGLSSQRESWHTGESGGAPGARALAVSLFGNFTYTDGDAKLRAAHRLEVELAELLCGINLRDEKSEKIVLALCRPTRQEAAPEGGGRGVQSNEWPR